jgi:enamine deaminase RidA (YjgF/YER057c/UK114 family)
MHMKQMPPRTIALLLLAVGTALAQTEVKPTPAKNVAELMRQPGHNRGLAPDLNNRKIGDIQPRQAKDIQASNWSVGASTAITWNDADWSPLHQLHQQRHAIAPHDSQVKVTAVASPLQCPALQYGSSFSRAVEVSLADRRFLSISGTASIAPDGKTAHPGDVRAQIDLTMRVVAAILESRRMNWQSVASSIAYCRHAADAPVFREWLVAHGLADLPVLLTENDICRDDLLFEFEAAAVQPVG